MEAVTFIASSSYGNDSIAQLQWLHENNIAPCISAYIDTGWASKSEADRWEDRVQQGEALARSYGFGTVRVKGKWTFPSLCLDSSRQAFPRHGMQFCTIHLKGIPFLEWIDEQDPERKFVICVAKRRAESRDRANIPEYIEKSEYHGERKVWHPLYAQSNAERDALIERAGFKILPHRSRECSPCINANRRDLQMLPAEDIEKVHALETKLEQTMFRAKGKMGAIGIHEVIRWAHSPRGKFKPKLSESGSGCEGGYCEGR